MLWAVVMAGGSGTRLWPLANSSRPKPLLKLFPREGTFLEETLKRLSPLIPPKRIYVIGSEAHLPALRRSARGVPSDQVIGEPVSKNTAATVTLGAWLIRKKDSNAFVLTLPADHRIRGRFEFQKSVRSAFELSKEQNVFSVFGVRPALASPSYGYLELGKRLSRGSGFELARFIEKPSEKRAAKFLKTGRYLWHAGIFLAGAEAILKAVERHAPRLFNGIGKLSVTGGTIRPAACFRALPKISFDYAVLEHLKGAVAVRGDYDWCDAGTWQALGFLWEKDREHNAACGLFRSSQACRNIVYADSKQVCLSGVNDLLIVDTPETLFVGKKTGPEKMRRLARHFSKK